MTQENCHQDLPTSSSYPLQVPLSGSSAPSGIFLRSIFEEEGLAGVEAHLNNYLDKWEAENPQSVEYVTDTGVCAREGFVKYILNQMVENGFNMETLITATPFDANTGEDLISTEEIMGLLENDDWFDKIFENVIANPEPVDELYIHERMMVESFDQYQILTQEQEKARDLKEQVTLRFLEHVNEWSRLSFGGISQGLYAKETYWAVKYTQLKNLLPNLANYRTLMRKIRDNDIWLQEQTKDGPSFGWGICNTNNDLVPDTNMYNYSLDEEHEL